MRLTAKQAQESVEWAWPDAVAHAARRDGLVVTGSEDYSVRFGQAVVLSLAADEGRVGEPAATNLKWLATVAVPGLLEDLREARAMAVALDEEGLRAFIASATAWPPAPPRVLRALVALQPAAGDVIRERARARHRPDPLRFDRPGHVTLDPNDLNMEDPTS